MWVSVVRKRGATLLVHKIPLVLMPGTVGLWPASSGTFPKCKTTLTQRAEVWIIHAGFWYISVSYHM